MQDLLCSAEDGTMREDARLFATSMAKHGLYHEPCPLVFEALATRLQSRWGGYQRLGCEGFQKIAWSGLAGFCTCRVAKPSCDLREVLDVFEELGCDQEIRLQRRAVTTSQLSDGSIDRTADLLTTAQVV